MAKEHRWLQHLAPHLPLAVPTPLALGRPGEGFPFPRSVRDWLPGEPPSGTAPARVGRALGAFLRALRGVDATGGPPAGARSGHRGGRLAVNDEQAREALRLLDDPNRRDATASWDVIEAVVRDRAERRGDARSPERVPRRSRST